jgi:hypothetical protein
MAVYDCALVDDNDCFYPKKIACYFVGWIQQVQDGCFETGDGLSGSIKDDEFYDQLTNCQLRKKNFAVWS